MSREQLEELMDEIKEEDNISSDYEYNELNNNRDQSQFMDSTITE